MSVKSCLRDRRVLRSITTTPPPSTVSTVLASRLGVRPSKSCTMLVVRRCCYIPLHSFYKAKLHTKEVPPCLQSLAELLCEQFDIVCMHKDDTMGCTPEALSLIHI